MTPLQAPRLRSSAGGRTPRLIIFGNGQAQAMSELMRDLPARNGQFDVLHLDYRALEQPDFGGESGLDLGYAPTLLWEQASDASSGAVVGAARNRLLALIPKGSRVVRFPLFSFSSLWPFEGQDPRLDQVGDAAQYPGGIRYPFTDRLAQTVAQEPGAAALPDDALYDLYAERFLPELPRLDRKLNFDTGRLKWRDRHSDIAMTSFILENFRERRLFGNSRHATGLLLREVLRGLLEASAGFSGLDTKAAQAGIDDLTARQQGQPLLQAPINPLVARHFHLRYGWEGERTTCAGSSWTFRDYIVSYMRWRAYAC